MTSKPIVLLIDDDSNIRTLFQIALEHHGIDLVAVAEANAALEFLETHSPDLIVLDIFLPAIDGYKLLKTIRALPHLSDCPIVATTAYYTTDTVISIQQAGFDGHLLKPFDPHELITYLKKALHMVP